MVLYKKVSYVLPGGGQEVVLEEADLDDVSAWLREGTGRYRAYRYLLVNAEDVTELLQVVDRMRPDLEGKTS